MDNVSIHVPTRGTTRPLLWALELPVWFQSTFPHGERQYRCGNGKQYRGFNPRSHTGNDQMLLVVDLRSMCFNPRSHTGNDDIGEDILPDVKVSIHVPTRGTTSLRIVIAPFSSVSIHVPTRGTTMKSRILQSISMFQSTFPHGERQTVQM